MKFSRKTKGFTLVEIIIAVVLAAMLMTALAVAFDASVKNYSANDSIFKSMNMSRQALQRMTTAIRTAGTIVLPGDEGTNQCTITDADGKRYTYEFRSADNSLYLIDNDVEPAKDYLLCGNVSNLNFTKTTGLVGEVTLVKNVQISMSVTIGGQTKTLNAAAVVRRNMR
jgi:prepilin-type N-terminal cleavage/methylation domain-containing protein